MSNNKDLSYWRARAIKLEEDQDRLEKECVVAQSNLISLSKTVNELAAMVGRLRDTCLDQAKDIMGEFQTRPTQTIDDFAPEVLRESPPEALRYIKADTLEHEADLMESAEQLSANGAFDMRQVAMRLRERARQYRDGEIE